MPEVVGKLSNSPESSNVNGLKITLVFFITGLCAGACFGWFTSLPSFTRLWFIQTTGPGLFTESSRFFVPTWSYRAALSITFLLGLTVSYVLSHKQGWLSRRIERISLRELFSAFILAAGAFCLESTGPIQDLSVTDFGFIFGPILLVLSLAIALWVITQKWYNFVFILMILTLVLRLALTFITVFTFKLGLTGIDIVYYSIGQSLLAALSGYWLFKANSLTASHDGHNNISK